LKVTYTEEAIVDIIEAISYLNKRNPTAAANLNAEMAQCIERLVAQEFDGPVSRLRSGVLVRSWAVPPFRIYYQRHGAAANRPRLPPDSLPYHPLVGRQALSADLRRAKTDTNSCKANRTGQAAAWRGECMRAKNKVREFVQLHA